MKIKDYIESGILEAYVLGSASEAEEKELLRLKTQYPQIQDALAELESDLERIAQHMAIAPPPGALEKIEDHINELMQNPKLKQLPDTRKPHDHGYSNNGQKTGQFIEVEGSSSHMRLHKAWRWVFAAVFVLGKIFLGFAIYYYLENRQLEKQLNRLEKENEQIRK